MKVSVICPVFDTRPDLLQMAVDSVLAQLGDALHEVILADDGSRRESTVAALAALASSDRRVVVLRASANAGPASARNRGLAYASGDWLAFIDADDLWPADKLAMAQAALREAPDADWIGCAETTLGVDGVLRPGPGLSCIPARSTPSEAVVELATPELTRCIMLEGIHLGANLIRRPVMQATGGFNPSIVYGEDWNLLAVISLTTRMHYVASAGYVLRRQFESMMWSAGRMSDRYMSGQRAALKDKRLRGFRREARWALYRAYKEVALNNAVNGHPFQGLRFALRALAVDPREIREFGIFIAAIAQAPFRQAIMPKLAAYSKAEIVRVSDVRR